MKANSLYVIYDAKAEFYRGPYVFRNKADAGRAFGRMAADKQSQVGQHPEDFIMYEVGTFNDLTGEVEQCAHVSLGKAIDYVAKV